MKSPQVIILTFLSLALAAPGMITIPGTDDSDGALVVAADTTIDLSLATAGDGTAIAWDSDNTANTGNGLYDPLKWAIVFKYSSVNIAAGATLTFTNHPSRAPVVWLVSGSVVIDGNVTLNGQGFLPAPNLTEPGPGGFRGGTATYSNNPQGGAGFGPGGGFQQNGNAGQGGSFGTSSGVPSVYGNPSLVPLIGGSGGAGDPEFSQSREGGGAGGGAILIACANDVTVEGNLQADGGVGFSASFNNTNGGGGSGGGIRIVSDSFGGTGTVRAQGGGGWQTGGLGRIRLERVANTSAGVINPDPSVVGLADGATALLWPPANAPTVKIVSIGGEAAPEDPRAEFGAVGADVTLPETATIQVILETAYVEQASQVKVRLTPRSGSNAIEIDAVVDTILNATEPIIRWTADIPVGNGYAAVQARVIRP